MGELTTKKVRKPRPLSIEVIPTKPGDNLTLNLNLYGESFRLELPVNVLPPEEYLSEYLPTVSAKEALENLYGMARDKVVELIRGSVEVSVPEKVETYKEFPIIVTVTNSHFKELELELKGHNLLIPPERVTVPRGVSKTLRLKAIALDKSASIEILAGRIPVEKSELKVTKGAPDVNALAEYWFSMHTAREIADLISSNKVPWCLEEHGARRLINSLFREALTGSISLKVPPLKLGEKTVIEVEVKNERFRELSGRLVLRSPVFHPSEIGSEFSLKKGESLRKTFTVIPVKDGNGEILVGIELDGESVWKSYTETVQKTEPLEFLSSLGVLSKLYSSKDLSKRTIEQISPAPELVPLILKALERAVMDSISLSVPPLIEGIPVKAKLMVKNRVFSVLNGIITLSGSGFDVFPSKIGISVGKWVKRNWKRTIELKPLKEGKQKLCLTVEIGELRIEKEFLLNVSPLTEEKLREYILSKLASLQPHNLPGSWIDNLSPSPEYSAKVKALVEREVLKDLRVQTDGVLKEGIKSTVTVEVRNTLFSRMVGELTLESELLSSSRTFPFKLSRNNTAKFSVKIVPKKHGDFRLRIKLGLGSTVFEKTHLLKVAKLRWDEFESLLMEDLGKISSDKLGETLKNFPDRFLGFAKDVIQKEVFRGITVESEELKEGRKSAIKLRVKNTLFGKMRGTLTVSSELFGQKTFRIELPKNRSAEFQIAVKPKDSGSFPLWVELNLGSLAFKETYKLEVERLSEDEVEAIVLEELGKLAVSDVGTVLSKVPPRYRNTALEIIGREVFGGISIRGDDLKEGRKSTVTVEIKNNLFNKMKGKLTVESELFDKKLNFDISLNLGKSAEFPVKLTPRKFGSFPVKVQLALDSLTFEKTYTLKVEKLSEEELKELIVERLKGLSCSEAHRVLETVPPRYLDTAREIITSKLEECFSIEIPDKASLNNIFFLPVKVHNKYFRSIDAVVRFNGGKALVPDVEEIRIKVPFGERFTVINPDSEESVQVRCNYAGKRTFTVEVISGELSFRVTKAIKVEPSLILPGSRDYILEGLRKEGFEIIAELGRGGFGIVYSAKRNNRMVAVKIPNRLIWDEILKWFEREARIWSQLNHENIVRLYSYSTGPIPYLEMELCNHSLRHVLMARGKLSFDTAVYVAYGVSEALSYAHSKGVHHLDVKPENIMIKIENESPIPKLTDWGLARRESSSVSRVGGTRSYMAPEVVAGKYHKKSDVYSLGVVLIEILTGYPAPRLVDDLDGRIREFVKNMLSEEPDARPEISEVSRFFEKRVKKVDKNVIKSELLISQTMSWKV